MKIIEAGVVLTLLAPLLTGCKKANKQQPVVCQQPTTLVAQAPCASGYADVVILKASGYSRAPDPTGQFIFDFYPQKDTVSSDLTVSAYKNASGDQISVPLTKLNNAPKFVVIVSMYCDGTAVHTGSAVFAFVKRSTANAACYTWGLQKM